jgi:Domain of unknown function (DUF4175)
MHSDPGNEGAMNERLQELQSILAAVRRRWTRRAQLRAWTLGATAAATVLLASVGAVLLVAREGLPLVLTIAIALAVAVFAIARAFWPLRRSPSNRQVARFVEENSPGLDDVLVTAVDYAERPEASPQMREWLAGDAVTAARGVSLDSVVSSASMRKWLWRGAAASVALLAVAALISPSFERAGNLAAAYLFPTRLAIKVTPGSTKVRVGEPVTITARLNGVDGGLTPMLRVIVGQQSREVRMEPAGKAGLFTLTIDKVTQSFAYSVSAAGARSPDYAITAVRPARVERIDVRYEFPKELGLEPRTDEDSGDIYAPAGTKVHLTITTDKPIASGALALADGSRLNLTGRDQLLEGDLTIEDDGSYRVALADVDGLESSGDTEYFIRTLDDRPPDVRILRPAGDKQVTPLEEIEIEARADDDYGIAAFELVFQAPGGKEKVVPFRGSKGGLTANGLHTMFMEDLDVQPGDFVTYFARARDVSRGRRSTEARSDIFFLEVKPFDEEFVAAQSQAMMGGGSGGDRGLQGLIEAQKEIIVATWKLDARARRARDAKPADDIRAVSKAQANLKKRAEEAGGEMARTLGDPRRRRSNGQAPGGSDPIGKAIEAMGRAVGELDTLTTSAALPHEMEALNQLLKADAENRRRQVARQQQAGGGGGMNRSEADLSSLFDRELRKRNQTNYETPATTEERQEEKKDDLLDKIRDLARRQDALNRQQRDLARNRAQIEEEELKRQLERLTREQNQLRQEADQLSRQMSQQRSGEQNQQNQQNQQGQQSQQASGQSSSGQSSQGQQGTRQLREISEEMRNAASDLGRQNPEQASARGERALERLRELERQVQTATPDDRHRALGDLQLESRQLADAQRRLTNEASKTGEGQAGQDARRRLAGEQERLADRAERLQENVKRMAKSGQGDAAERKATEDAARELERQQLDDRMRKAADGLRNNQNGVRQGEDVARALDQVAQRLGAAAGTEDADSKRWSDQLARTQEMRERIAGLQRDIDKLQRESEHQAQGQSRNGQTSPQNGQQNSAQNGQQSQNGSGREGATGEQGGGETGGNRAIQELQREVNERMREMNRLADDIRRESTGGQGPRTPEEWWRSFSAPGTEAFKQDFSRWESLKKNLLLALEQVETNATDQLRTREKKERLNAGGHAAVSESYRELVEKYYRSLATPRKPQQ